MTHATEHAEAMKLLRETFKEPEWKDVSLRGGGGGRWYAVAQTRPWPGGDYSLMPGGFVTIDAKGESPLAAARALIAAWREATGTDHEKALAYDATHSGDWLDRAHAVAQRTGVVNVGRDVWHICVEQAEAHLSAQATTDDVNAALKRMQARLDSVRPVVAAALLWRDEFGGRRECELFNAAVDALPADAREWAKE